MSLIFALMIAVSVVWLLWFWYRPLKNNRFDLEKSNIELGRQKQAELENDLAQGLIDERVFEQAQTDIAQTLAVELKQHSTLSPPPQNNPNIALVMLSVVFIIMMSLGLYQALTTTKQTLNLPLNLTQSAVKLQAHIKDNPNDAGAWKMLGLAYFELNDLDKSLNAYEKSYQLDAKNPRLLVEYASAIATKNNDNFDGRAIELVKQALMIEPNSPDALYMAGLYAVSQQDFKLAELLWRKSLSKLTPNSAEHTVLVEVLAELSQLRGETASAYAIKVNVVFSKQILNSRSPQDYLMIYAKAAKGRPMPIAIVKIKLKDFTGQVILDDSHSVIPNNTLSQANAVVIVARLSKTGAAFRQADDIQTTSEVIRVGDNLVVNLRVE